MRILKNKGFTLIEVLAVIVIIAIIAAIAVPAVKNILTESKKDTFGLSAQKVLDGVLQQEAINDEFEATEVSVQNLKYKLKIANTNYETLFITLTNDNEYYIYIAGKNKWKGLVACGTHGDITVETKADAEICYVYDSNFVCGNKLSDSRDQQEYDTVEIGNNCWMAEDLRWECNNFIVLDPDYYGIEGWDEATDWCAPSGVEDGVNYSDTMLYQWGAVATACPSGWHVPSEGEWEAVRNHYSPKEGDKIKGNDKVDWCSTSGAECYMANFNANPSGYRSTYGGLEDAGYTNFWWTNTYADGKVSVFTVYANQSFIASGNYDNLEFGYALRCVKDK